MMTKKFSVSAFLLLSIFTVNGQQPKTSLLYDLVSVKRLTSQPTEISGIFNKAISPPSAKINALLSEKIILSLDRKATLAMYKNKPISISLPLPSIEGVNYKLEMVQQDINSSSEFSFGALEGKEIRTKTDTLRGLHYRGYVYGDPSSIASFSIFSNGEIMCLFSNRKGNFNIGKASGAEEEYVLYNSKNMVAFPGFICGTYELPAPRASNNPSKQINPLRTESPPTLLCKKVRMYWEAGYKLYRNNFDSSLTNTANYIAGLFNQVATMYQNEGILIELTDTYIWTTPDPYTKNTAANGLATFKNRWNGLDNNFKADLAVLLDGAPTNNGGLAYILDNELCNRTYTYGYVDLYAAYNTVPVYSWDVFVLTHEIGHLLGSNHTQWCGWKTGVDGTCGAIDDCGNVEPSPSCASCIAATSINPVPPDGFEGTVMSYCHVKPGVGVNLANGFGPLPQAAMRSSIDNAVCPVYNNVWTGAVSTAWEDPANWQCETIPGATTDVTISSGLANYPVISSNATCRRITLATNATVLVKTGFNLTVTGPPD